MRKHKTPAQLSECVKQAIKDLRIEKHKQHKEVVDSGLVRIINEPSAFISIYVNDIIVHYDLKDKYTKQYINAILDTVVAMKLYTNTQLQKRLEQMQNCLNCAYFDVTSPKYCRKGVYREGQYVCSIWECAMHR